MNELIKAIRERVTDPMLGTIVLAFLIWNAEACLYFLMSKQDFDTRLDSFKARAGYGSYLHLAYYWNIYVFPLLFGFFYKVAVEYISGFRDVILDSARIFRLKRSKNKREEHAILTSEELIPYARVEAKLDIIKKLNALLEDQKAETSRMKKAMEREAKNNRELEEEFLKSNSYLKRAITSLFVSTYKEIDEDVTPDRLDRAIIHERVNLAAEHYELYSYAFIAERNRSKRTKSRINETPNG